ncbi:MAG TPA: hypothetical protein VGG41_07060 [Solirubrobacteraceae bacterium]
MASNLLLRLLGDNKDANAKVDETSGKVDEFGKKRATADLRVSADQAKAELAEVLTELRAIPREETIRIRVEAETAKLQVLEARMKALNDQSAAGLTDSQASAVAQRMGTIATQIDASRTRLEGFSRDLDNLGESGERDFSKITNSLTKVRGGLADLVGHIPLLGGLMKGAINVVSSGLQSVVTMLPEAAQGFAGMVAAGLGLLAVGPIVVGIAAALAAVVVSLAQALIGVLALGVAFLAALGPIALVVGALILKLKDAYQAQQKVTQATQSQRAAVLSLQQAQQAESQQRLAALQAEKDAVLQLHDAQDQLADAKLNERATQLAVSQARLALQQFASGMGLSVGELQKKALNVDVSGSTGQTQVSGNPFGSESQALQYKGLVLQLAQAEQQHRDSIDQTADAQDGANKAQATANDFAKRGLDAYGPYSSAVIATAKATVALHSANVTLAKDTSAMAASDGVLGVFDRLKRTLGTILGPATRAAFSGLGKAFDILANGLKPLEGPLGKLGEAIGKGFVQLARALTSKTAIGEFKQLISGAAKLVPTLVAFFSGIGGVLVGVANAAMPHLISGLGKLGGKFTDVAKHPKQIREFIDKCITQTKHWLDGVGAIVGVAKTLAGVFKAFEPVLKSIWGIASAIGKVLGVGPGGVIVGLALLSKFGGGAGGLLSTLLGAAGGGGAGGALAKVGLAGMAGAAGYGIGTELYQHVGAVRGAGNATAGAIDSLLGVDSTNPASYAKQAGFTNITQALEKSLATGIEQIGPHMGQRLSKLMESRFLEILKQDGIHYTGPVAALAGAGHHTVVHQQNHFHGGSAEPQHAAAVITRRMRGMGGGLRG